MNQSGNVEAQNPESVLDSKETVSNGEQPTTDNAQAYGSRNDFQGYGRDQQRNGYGANGSIPAYSSYYQYAGSYYDPFMDVSTPFTTKFPRAKDYSNPQSISEAFPHLKQVNDPEFDIESISSDAQFYILRSSNDDNIHKAIKYQVWTSTPTGKNILRRAWHDFIDAGKEPEIYLIFSVVSSNQFLGVAKMTSDIDDDESFKYWWEPCKWFGTFQISWHFVKDIHHAKFEQIKEESVNTSVINLKDGTMISAKTGKQMLAVFKSFSNKPSIFDFFDYMDRREDYIRSQRDDNPEFERYFNECCEAYLENPDNLFPQKRFYNKRSPRKNNYDNRGKKILKQPQWQLLGQRNQQWQRKLPKELL
jgi:hypothetical protein